MRVVPMGRRGDGLSASAWPGHDALARMPRSRRVRGDSVAAMTRVAGLNGRTFARRFRQATGLALLEYALRLEEARQMLEATELPVAAIALDVGCVGEGSFVRLFKRSVNMTPAQYRRRHAGLRETLRMTAAAAA